jgi:hypothetical protein
MDVVTAVKIWLAVRPIKRLKERRRAKRAAAAASGSSTPPEETAMNANVLTQIVLGVLRHAMTALAPLGFAVSDDGLVQIAGVIVTAIGLAWSAMRKVNRAAS